MTNKETPAVSSNLDEIKQKYMSHEYDYNLKSSDIDWLIKQVEQMQELKEKNIQLEKDIKEWGVVNECWEEINTRLVEQNKCYREALEFYEYMAVVHNIIKDMEEEE